jgi:hypothetical protein
VLAALVERSCASQPAATRSRRRLWLVSGRRVRDHARSYSKQLDRSTLARWHASPCSRAMASARVYEGSVNGERKGDVADGIFEHDLAIIIAEA